MANVIRQPCDLGIIRSGEARAPCSRSAGPWVLAATILGSGMAFIDATAVTVALPAIQDALGATGVDAQWAAEAYTLDRKSTRLNSSHANISYAVFCLK